MRRSRSPGSDTSEVDMDGMHEVELQKLQRQYRIMENDRDAYTQESQNQIRKQKHEISQLEEEKKELLKNLRLAESRSNQSKDEDNTEELQSLCQIMDELEREMEEERQKQKELDQKTRELQKQSRAQHKSMGGVHMSSQHTVQTQKKTRTLENRLDKALKSFNDMLAGNATMRDEIDSLRVERARFEGLNKKLDKELDDLRREIGEIIDSSTQAYDQRDECQAKMILLKEKADKDLQQHNTEMKELVRIIDHDRKLREFMGIKGLERQEDQQMVQWRTQKILEDERRKEAQEDSIETYEAAMESIKQITGEDDVDLLVEKFIETEDKNFALFNYVNEQNNTMENLQEDIQAINEDMRRFKAQGVEMEEQRKHIISKLEADLENAKREADEYETKNKEISKILDQLRAGVDSLFKKIQCDDKPIEDMLGAQAGVTESNMIQYLGIIEQRTNELLGMKIYIEAQDQGYYDPKSTGLLGEGPKSAQPQAPVFPPGIGDEYESEASEGSDEDLRPMTRNELQKRVMKTVRKRESAARREGFKYDLSGARDKTKQQKKK